MDRYSVLKSGEQREWLADCPVKVEKYNILIDNMLNRNVIQIKFVALGERKIRTVWVDVLCYDDAMDYITTVSDVTYSNLTLYRGMSFGDRQPVSVNSNSVSNIRIVVKKIAFADDSVWRNENGEIGVLLPQQTSAMEFYGELYNQFYIEAQKIKAKPEKALNISEGFWQCTCGQGNANGEENCILCASNLNELIKISNAEYLAEQNDNRIKNERAENEKLAKVRAENKKKKAKKIRKVVIILIAWVVLVCAGGYIYLKETMQYYQGLTWDTTEEELKDWLEEKYPGKYDSFDDIYTLEYIDEKGSINNAMFFIENNRISSVWLDVCENDNEAIVDIVNRYSKLYGLLYKRVDENEKGCSYICSKSNLSVVYGEKLAKINGKEFMLIMYQKKE